MGWFRLPLFVWAHLRDRDHPGPRDAGARHHAAAAHRRALRAHRHLRPALGGDPVLFQHFFWFYSHPAVYIMIVPGMGVISELISTFSRKPIFGYRFIAYSSVRSRCSASSCGATTCSCRASRELANMVFSALTFLVAIPSAIKVFNWVATLYKGAIQLKTPMLYALSFLLPLHDRRPHRPLPRHARRSTSTSTTRTSSSRTSTTSWWAGRSSRFLGGAPLLVAEVHRQACTTRRSARSCCVRRVRRLQRDVPPAVRHGLARHAAPLLGLRPAVPRSSTSSRRSARSSSASRSSSPSCYLFASFKDGKKAPRNPWGAQLARVAGADAADALQLREAADPARALQLRRPRRGRAGRVGAPRADRGLAGAADMLARGDGHATRSHRRRERDREASSASMHATAQESRASRRSVPSTRGEDRQVGRRQRRDGREGSRRRGDDAADRAKSARDRRRAEPKARGAVDAAKASRQEGRRHMSTAHDAHHDDHGARPPRLAVHPAPLRRRAAPVRLRQARHLAVPRAGSAVLLGAVRRVRPVPRTTTREIYAYAHKYLDVKYGRDQHRRPDLLVADRRVGRALRAAQSAQGPVLCSSITIVCAFGFLGIKYIEYSHKIHEHILFGRYFDPCVSPGGNALPTKSNECPGSKSARSNGTRRRQGRAKAASTRARSTRPGRRRHPGRLRGLRGEGPRAWATARRRSAKPAAADHRPLRRVEPRAVDEASSRRSSKRRKSSRAGSPSYQPAVCRDLTTPRMHARRARPLARRSASSSSTATTKSARTTARSRRSASTAAEGDHEGSIDILGRAGSHQRSRSAKSMLLEQRRRTLTHARAARA